MRKFRVADLFCGAGGFSEGFRQRGFDITCAVDSWKIAAKAFSANHSEARVLGTDISELNPTELGDIDVLIGSPPCNYFSYSNNAGNGDVVRGLRLVFRFLECVAQLKPRYWIMENIPRLRSLMCSNAFTNGLESRGISARIPCKVILNAADFGAPQRRFRLIIGNFPIPRATHSQTGSSLYSLTGNAVRPWVPMRRVFDAFPNPMRPRPDSVVSDPNYPEMNLPAANLSDHFYDCGLSSEQASTNRAKKTNHPWCGKMRFPDSLDKPARTVTALQAKTARETIVIECCGGSGSEYRTPTAREYACLQTFPITYRFPCKGLSTKIRLIGNAIPPMMAGALADAILLAEDGWNGSYAPW
jgi:DNA (cytosine-5)-methyltransferase 1